MVTWFLEWMLIIGVAFIGFGLLGGSSLAVRRRPRFWTRVSLLCLGMVGAQLALFGAMDLKLLPEHVLMAVWLMLIVSALVIAPACCYLGAGPPPGSSDGGSGGGGEPLLPTAPQGGIPLPDSRQSDARVRDHARPKLHHPGPRRAAREPARLPTGGRRSRRSDLPSSPRGRTGDQVS